MRAINAVKFVGVRAATGCGVEPLATRRRELEPNPSTCMASIALGAKFKACAGACSQPENVPSLNATTKTRPSVGDGEYVVPKAQLPEGRVSVAELDIICWIVSVPPSVLVPAPSLMARENTPLVVVKS